MLDHTAIGQNRQDIVSDFIRDRRIRKVLLTTIAAGNGP
jgi:hypothetical protein